MRLKTLVLVKVLKRGLEACAGSRLRVRGSHRLLHPRPTRRDVGLDTHRHANAQKSQHFMMASLSNLKLRKALEDRSWQPPLPRPGTNPLLSLSKVSCSLLG